MAHEARLFGPGGGGHGNDDDEEFFDPAGPHDEDAGGVPEEFFGGDEEEEDDHQEEVAEDGDARGMAALVRTLRDIARQAGYDPYQAVQLNKLRIVLEAVGGDLDLAATLYWDDFLATANNQQQFHPAPLPQERPMMMMGAEDPAEMEFQHDRGDPPGHPVPPVVGHQQGARQFALALQDEPVVDERQRARGDARAGRSADRNREGGRNRQEELPDAEAGLDGGGGGGGGGGPPHQFMGGLVIDDSSPLVRRLDDAFRRIDGSVRNLRLQELARSQALDMFNRISAQAHVRRPPRPPPPPPPPREEDAGEGDPRARNRRSARLAASGAPSGPLARGGEDVPRPRRPSGRVRRAQQQGDVEDDGEGRRAGDSGNRSRRRGRDDPSGHERAIAVNVPDPRELLQAADNHGNDENSHPIQQGGEAARPEKNPTLRSMVEAAMRRHKRQDLEDIDMDGRNPSPLPAAKRRRSDASAGSGTTRGTGGGRALANGRSRPQLGPDDEYLSDNDWIWEGTSDTPSSSRKSRGDVDKGPDLGPPTEVLWGLSEGSLTIDTIGRSHRSSSKETSNVIKDDQEEPPMDADDEEATSGIPRTWLAAGFALSECSNALCVKPPSEDDLGFFAWKRQIQRNTPPPPYHCRSVSAVLSIVTATILTGASIQAGHVTTSSSKPPFFELSEELRKREFEARLADALSAILLIAVQASVSRKKLALKAACAESGGRIPSDEVEKVTWSKLQHRLGLVPTCSWDTDPNTGDIRFEDDAPAQVVTTLTHVDDIRCYVLSNLKSFMSSGGVALFLETLLRIHGTGAIGKMLHQSGMSNFLIRCTCEERHAAQMQEMQQRSLGLGVPGAPAAAPSRALTSDSTFSETECISVQLVSLILTGKVHSNWQGWDTGPLGFGVLTNPINPASFVDKRLSRPKKPVWVLLGPTCYSVMYMVGCPDHADEFSLRDYPGTVAHMRHWNVWFGQRRLTNFRLTVGRRVEESSTFSTSTGNSLTAAAAIPSELPSVRVLRERMQARIRSEIGLRGVEAVDPELMFTQEEIDRVSVHPDDPKFYPAQFRLWRYDLDQPETADADDSGSALDQKQRARTWTPFCRLAAREKQLVETRFGPAIRRILLTRWPWSSTLDRFEPDDPAPVV